MPDTLGVWESLTAREVLRTLGALHGTAGGKTETGTQTRRYYMRAEPMSVLADALHSHGVRFDVRGTRDARGSWCSSAAPLRPPGCCAPWR